MPRREREREKNAFEWINSHNYNNYVFNWCDMFDAFIIVRDREHRSMAWAWENFHDEGLVNVNAMQTHPHTGHNVDNLFNFLFCFFVLFKIKFNAVKSHVEIIFRVHNSLIKLGLKETRKRKYGACAHIAVIGAMILFFSFLGKRFTLRPTRCMQWINFS